MGRREDKAKGPDAKEGGAIKQVGCKGLVEPILLQQFLQGSSAILAIGQAFGMEGPAAGKWILLI